MRRHSSSAGNPGEPTPVFSAARMSRDLAEVLVVRLVNSVWLEGNPATHPRVPWPRVTGDGLPEPEDRRSAIKRQPLSAVSTQLAMLPSFRLLFFTFALATVPAVVTVHSRVSLPPDSPLRVIAFS